VCPLLRKARTPHGLRVEVLRLAPVVPHLPVGAEPGIDPALLKSEDSLLYAFAGDVVRGNSILVSAMPRAAWKGFYAFEHIDDAGCPQVVSVQAGRSLSNWENV
jgi:hypothetical protein